MQYELRYQVIEPRRHTFQYLIDRYGDQATTRYIEGTVGVQPTENFHYRPTWGPSHELYDVGYSSLRLADPYSFLDPRAYYYANYVATRCDLHERFGQTLDYLEKRGLIAGLPDAWRTVLAQVVLPLRHYESGAQLVSVAGARFAYGTSIEQCCSFAAFDRMGNAQILSRMGLSLGSGTRAVLDEAKAAWTGDDRLQPLRRLTEEMMASEDWAEGLLASDLTDSVIYPVLFSGLDSAALLSGAGAVSLLFQHLASWYSDQRRWIDALMSAWAADPEHGQINAMTLFEWRQRWLPRVVGAFQPLANTVDEQLPGVGAGDQARAQVQDINGRWDKLFAREEVAS